MRGLRQQARLAILAIYIVLLLVASKLALGTMPPPTSEKGLWFYSGLAALLLGSLILEPFYSPPADTISNGVAALIALLAVDVQERPVFDRFFWYSLITYATVVIVSGVMSIVFKDSRKVNLQRLARSLSVFSASVGTPKPVFSAVYLFSLVTFHRDSPREYLTISAVWTILIIWQPLERTVKLWQRFQKIFQDKVPPEQLGEIVGHQTPGLVLVCEDDDSKVSMGDPLLVRTDDGKPGLAMALDHVGYTDGCWRRAIHLPTADTALSSLPVFETLSNDSNRIAFRLKPDDCQAVLANSNIWKDRIRLVGLVAPDSDTSHLRIEVIRTDLDLYEGQLTEVSIGPKTALFQLIRGLTKEEILSQKNTHGYVRADARKVGSWSTTLGAFEAVRWVPQPNTPVFLVDIAKPNQNRNAIGHFPGTDYPVSVDATSLVRQNGAILGILGVGKTYLAIELVERMISKGIKVIYLDLTDQYSQELALFYDEEAATQRVDYLQDQGPSGRTRIQQNVEEGGSINAFRENLREVLSDFLLPETDDMVAIFNPADFEVWRQDSKIYSKTASMASLTPAEITRLFTETALELLQSHGMTDEARCCLVFEEAHSLIPEWNAVANAGDKAATNGTAKAILQGRKFGLGCLVVTQRTANVTKSILNQCNTVFALRVFDATGMGFLTNYIGDDYAGVLSTLEDRHAVVFGRASSCRDPVLIRLNDREDFLAAFRDPVPDTETRAE